MRRITLLLTLLLTTTLVALGQTVDLSGETNLALNKTATAGWSEGDAWNASKAVDGNAGTKWSGYVADHLNDNWWRVDLDNSESFNTIRIQFNDQAPREAKLQYSTDATITDGTVWTDIMTIGSNHGNAADNKACVYKFDAVTAQHVRIQCVTGGTYGMGFNEFEVYNSTYKLTSVSVDKTTIPAPATTTLSFYAYDQFGSDYTNYTLTSSGAGTSANETTITTNPHVFNITTGAVYEAVTLTATDNADTNNKKTATLSAEKLTLTSIAFLTSDNEKDFLSKGDYIEIQPVDQFGNLYTGEGLSRKIVVNGVEQEITNDGNPRMGGTTILYTVPTDYEYATVQFKATAGATSVTRTFYVLGSALPSPGVPTNVYQPIYCNGDIEYNNTVVWQGEWNEQANTSLEEITLTDGLVLKPIRSCGSLAIGNTESPFNGAAINYNPNGNNCKELHIKLFSAREAIGHIYDEGTNKKDFTLNANSWTDVVLDISDVTNITTIKVKMDKIDGRYPEVLVSNVYFTKNSTNSDLPTFAEDYPKETHTKFTATITLKGTDPTSENLHYILKDHTSGKLYGYVKAAKDKEKSFTIEGLNSNTAYTVDVELYDEAGNKCATVKEVSFTTLDFSLGKVVATPAVISMEKEKTAGVPLTITVYDEDGDVFTNASMTIGVAFDSEDTSDGKADVATYNSETKYFTGKTGVTEGHGNYKVSATYGSSTVTTTVEVFVYNPALTIKFTIDGTEYTTNGSIGELKTALEDKITAESAALSGKTYMDITSLTVSGNINDKDIRVIREMAGATFTSGTTAADSVPTKSNYQNPEVPESSTGSLTTLDIKGVKFVSTLSYANNVANDATEAEKTQREKERRIGSYVIGLDAYNGAGKEEHPGFITAGGYIPMDVSYQGDIIGVGGHEILPSYIFDHCIHLQSVTLPDGIKQFGSYCFNACSNLTTVSNYGDVIDFGSYAFAKTAMTTFDLTQASSDLKTIGTGMFRGCEELTGVTMPSTLRKIGNAAFRECPKFNLVEGALPASLTEIGEYGFWKCESLTKVDIPEGVKKIEGYVFEQCSSLTDVTIESAKDNTLVSIGYRAFTDCKKLKNLEPREFGSTLNLIEDWAFAGCESIEGEINLANTSLVKINSQSFGWMPKLETVQLPATIKEIDNQAFQDDKKLATFSLGMVYNTPGDPTSGVVNNGYENLERIGANAFNGCELIENVFNNDGLKNVKTIGEMAFKNCKNLQSDEARHLMDILEKIEAETFAGCTSLEWLALGQSGKLKEIGPGAFADDKNVTKVSVYSATAPTCYIFYDEMTYRNDTTWVNNDRTQGIESVTLNVEDGVKKFNKNPFANLTPNHVWVDFSGVEATTYRAEMTDGTYGEVGGKQGNGFMYLLTKVMREEGNKLAEDGDLFTFVASELQAEDVDAFAIPIPENNAKGKGKYDVVNQAHADVILERSFLKNWNTLMLPFAMTSAHLENTFKATDGYQAVPAKFGWNNNGTMIYVKGSSTDRNSMLQFETLTEVAANTPYIFKIQKKTSSTEDKMVANTKWNIVDVDINADPQTVEGAGYIFRGSYDDQANIVSDDYGILYINANSAFSYKLAGGEGTKTRMKGFRSYFTFDNPAIGGAKMISVEMFDDGAITGIDEIEMGGVNSSNNELRGDIYSINGQLLRRNATTAGLAPGIYIVNGKKVSVK